MPTSATTRTSTQSRATRPASSSCVDRALASLTTRQRVGQVLMVGLPAESPDSWASSVAAHPVGGIFLAGRSTADSQQLADEVAAAQLAVAKTSGVKAQVAVDQEGGFVQSVGGADFPDIPPAVQQGQESVSELAASTATWSSRLVKAGITLDLAPVADTVPAGTEAANPPIGQQDRQYGSDPADVAESVSTVVTAMAGVGLGSTVKHFPGLGRVTENTDTGGGATDDQTTADDPYLQPFKAGISAHATAVMMSSARYPQLDPDNIAAFSPAIINGLLRGTLGFKGLVISDDLGAAVAVSEVPVGQRAVDFLRAGGDMVLTVQLGDLAAMTAALTAGTADPAFRKRLDDAVRHVLASKQAVGLLPCR